MEQLGFQSSSRSKKEEISDTKKLKRLTTNASYLYMSEEEEQDQEEGEANSYA